MKFFKLLIAAFILLVIGVFIFTAVTPVNITQSETTKTIDAEPFLNNES